MTEKELEIQATVNDNEKVLVDFWATWCQPCLALNSILEKVKELDPNVKIVKVNVEENEDLSTKYKISALPTLFLFKNKKLIGSFQGLINEKTILDKFEES